LWGWPLSSSTKTFEKWNRKLHFYLGLYFLFFLWLFSLTGLMLNHGQWAVSIAANTRTESRYERAVERPTGETDLQRSRDVMRQLGIAGEIDIPPQVAGRLQFNTSRPGGSAQVRVNLQTNLASVQQFENSHLGRFRNLHTFSGSRYAQPESSRDWILTRIWVLAMDALSAGLIVMVVGSYYMWWRLKRAHWLGVVSLGAGFAACAWFVAGWRL
jgi:hypothetical protein